jgi:hypothetical protein
VSPAAFRTLTKARDQLLDQSAAADLAEKVANKIPEAWAGSAFDHKQFKMTIFTTRHGPCDTAQALAESRGEMKAVRQGVRIKRVALSAQELDALGSSMRQKLNERNVSLNGLILDFPTNTVQVMLPEIESEPERKAQDSAAQTVAADSKNVVLQPRKGRRSQLSCRQVYQVCNPPLRGGLEIYDEKPTVTCTGTFPVREPH